MAPRSAKAKKTLDTKISDTEAPEKGISRVSSKKIKVLEEESSEILEKSVPKTDKKTCGRKDLNGHVEENLPSIKKGNKRKEPTAVQSEIPKDIVNVQTEANSLGEVPAINGKGHKRLTKKQTGGKNVSHENTSKKASKEQSDNEESVPKKTNARGRKAQPNIDSELKNGEVKSEPVVKGKKKVGTKGGKSKDVLETQNAEENETEQSNAAEEKTKLSRGRKKQTKILQDNNEQLDKHQDQEPASKKLKLEVGKGEPKEEEPNIAKSAKGKRGRKPAAAAPEDQELQDTGETTNKRRRKPGKRGRKPAAAAPEDQELQDTGETTNKRRRKPDQENDKNKTKLKNKNTTDYDSIEFSNTSKNAQDKEWNFKICSWNVDGIRAWLGKGGLDYIKYEKPDILCLQEVKCSREMLPEEIANVPGYHAYWLCSDQDGYAGVGIYTSKLAMSVQYGLQDEALDAEGRIITAEYEQFYLICTYVPNAGRKLVTLPKRLQWNEAFHKYVKELDKKKPVIICGDMNVAHNEIDLANPKSNRKNAGFTEEERSGMTNLLSDGFVDTFRHFYPDQPDSYTFWTYMMNSRAKNVGWRLDYFIVSEKLLPSVCDNTIRSQVYGSDHCPIALFLHLTSADKPKKEN